MRAKRHTSIALIMMISRTAWATLGDDVFESEQQQHTDVWRHDNQSISMHVTRTRTPGFVAAREAVTLIMPASPGDGALVEVFNGISGDPRPADIRGLHPDGVILSPFIDFPNPGQVIAVGQNLAAFFAQTTVPPGEFASIPAANFILRVSGLLRITSDLDLEPRTPEIDIRLGIGSDDGFHLIVGSSLIDEESDRPFKYSWSSLEFEAEGLYPVTLLFGANLVGQSGLEFAWNTARAGSEIIPRDVIYLGDLAIERIGERVAKAEEGSRSDKLRATYDAAALLRLHGQTGDDLYLASALLDLTHERETLIDDNLSPYVEAVRSAEDDHSRGRAMVDLRLAVLERATHFSRTAPRANLAAADVRRNVMIARYAAQLADDLSINDITDIEQWTRTPRGRKALIVLQGAAALVEGVETNDASALASGLRDSLGRLNVGPLKLALDIPAAAATAIVGTSTQGMDECTTTLNHIADAIGGDEQAFRRAAASARRVEQILSGDNYGRAIAGAFVDRIFKKTPVLRTIYAWWYG